MEKNEMLIGNSEENRTLLQKEDKCDKYDYLAAVACGAVGGLVDIFLVGTPGDSVLGKWSDAQADKAVMIFAKIVGWNPKEAQKGNVASAIGYLERKYRVNYDQKNSSNVGNLFLGMTASNHRMMSLAHSPDIIGLFFSILNQFTSTASFIADGHLITVRTETYELQGSNFISKIFCGIANWFGHIMSDVASTPGTRGKGGRGMGVVIPFYELFQFCKFGKFSVGDDKQDLATLAMKAFEKGYDLRFGVAMAIPVIITDLSIRLIWAIRRHFQYDVELKDCIPTQKHAELRVMLLFGNGVLCVMDGIDAWVRSGGDFLAFFMRLNLIAWFRFVALVLKEVCIRVGIKDSLQDVIDAYKRLNEALVVYLKELEKIDFELFQKETEQYNKLLSALKTIDSDVELNKYLLSVYDELDIKKPWEGDFDEHMSDKNGKLVFE